MSLVEGIAAHGWRQRSTTTVSDFAGMNPRMKTFLVPVLRSAERLFLTKLAQTYHNCSTPRPYLREWRRGEVELPCDEPVQDGWQCERTMYCHEPSKNTFDKWGTWPHRLDCGYRSKHKHEEVTRHLPHLAFSDQASHLLPRSQGTLRHQTRRFRRHHPDVYGRQNYHQGCSHHRRHWWLRSSLTQDGFRGWWTPRSSFYVGSKRKRLAIMRREAEEEEKGIGECSDREMGAVRSCGDCVLGKLVCPATCVALSHTRIFPPKILRWIFVWVVNSKNRK